MMVIIMVMMRMMSYKSVSFPCHVQTIYKSDLWNDLSLVRFSQRELILKSFWRNTRTIWVEDKIWKYAWLLACQPYNNWLCQSRSLGRSRLMLGLYIQPTHPHPTQSSPLGLRLGLYCTAVDRAGTQNTALISLSGSSNKAISRILEELPV